MALSRRFDGFAEAGQSRRSEAGTALDRFGRYLTAGATWVRARVITDQGNEDRGGFAEPERVLARVCRQSAGSAAL
ncbi:MAG TPA: hypothetical protein VKP30_11695 [Polyangiaceae bacterium]|nr:hypothetical protein [Polyangiaceae bacterium]